MSLLLFVVLFVSECISNYSSCGKWEVLEYYDSGKRQFENVNLYILFTHDTMIHFFDGRESEKISYKIDNNNLSAIRFKSVKSDGFKDVSGLYKIDEVNSLMICISPSNSSTPLKFESNASNKHILLKLKRCSQ